MKKLLPIILIIIVVIVAVGIRVFLGKEKVVTLPGKISKEAGETGESFTGKLKDAIAKNIPLRCTYAQGGNTGTSYIKGNRVYGEFLNQGKEGYLIIVDKCMWTWNKGENKGLKMCFETNIWEEGQGTMTAVPTDAEYKCNPVMISDTQFNPPNNVTFTPMEDFIQKRTDE